MGVGELKEEETTDALSGIKVEIEVPLALGDARLQAELMLARAGKKSSRAMGLE
jgi:hypothetical protein